MESLLSDPLIIIGDKLIACRNSFHLASSSESTTNSNVSSVPNGNVINRLRVAGLERISMKWILHQLDIEIKPPTSEDEDECYRREKEERQKLWLCFSDICKTNITSVKVRMR